VVLFLLSTHGDSYEYAIRNICPLAVLRNSSSKIYMERINLGRYAISTLNTVLWDKNVKKGEKNVLII
jgi:hypothetical protein